MIRETLITALALVSIGSVVAAQTNGDPAVDIGSRIRLKTAPAAAYGWLSGRVVALSEDSLWLARTGTGKPRAVPLGSIRRLEVSRGRRSNLLKGLGIGLASGVVLGGAIGFIEGGDPPCETGAFVPCFRFSAEEKAAAYALVLGGVGALLGGVIGAVTHTERWAEVQPAAVRLDVGADGALTLSTAYRF